MKKKITARKMSEHGSFNESALWRKSVNNFTQHVVASASALHSEEDTLKTITTTHPTSLYGKGVETSANLPYLLTDGMMAAALTTSSFSSH